MTLGLQDRALPQAAESAPGSPHSGPWSGFLGGLGQALCLRVESGSQCHGASVLSV